MARSKLEALDVGVAEFKANCTTIMPRVARTGRVVRVLKRGKVLVEIHPPAGETPEPFVGRLKGTATAMDDVISPIDEPWDAHGE